jgi:hypothetical protein
MDFDIQAHALMREQAHRISLPQKTREDLGVLVGQFLQLRGKEEVVLQVANAIVGPLQNVAYVSPEVFERIQGENVEFKVLEVTLGCDPEFFILWNNRLIIASNYLPFIGQVGSDGGLGELRPTYGRHESQVVSNLRGLISKIPSSMKKTPWLKGFPEDGREFSYQAHSYYQETPAGFHVHLGIPPEILNTRKDFNRAAINHIVRCLDWYVSVPTVPLEVAHERRLANGKYGQPGDYRPSNVTLEYRTPGGFYLRTPALAAGLMGMSLLVTETVVSRMKTASNGFVNLHKLTEADLQEILPIPDTSVVKNVLTNRNTRLAEEQIPAIYEAMVRLPTFKKHQEAIDGFLRVVKDRSVPNPDLLLNWKEHKA